MVCTLERKILYIKAVRELTAKLKKNSGNKRRLLPFVRTSTKGNNTPANKSWKDQSGARLNDVLGRM